VIPRELTSWEKFKNGKYFEAFKWSIIVASFLILVGIVLIVCRCCFFKKVRVDPRGLSDQDLQNPDGSIRLTKEL
jgi:hypothetical protein